MPRRASSHPSMIEARTLPKLAYAICRIAIPGGRWSYRGRGHCASCGRTTMFVLAQSHARWIERLTRDWDSSASFKQSLPLRESLICVLCRANLRVRLLARAVLDRLQLPDAASLLGRMRSDARFAIYEAATWNAFRDDRLTSLPNYVSSEYIDGARPGDVVDGVMNQDLERLTFESAAFDIVITSEVLEHVADLERALSEIRRVLKPGGLHVFTVPVDTDQARSRERAQLADGKIVHLLPAIYHGDSRRPQGILAFRDFGRDVADYLSRPGFACERTGNESSGEIASPVLVSQKTA
jgi:SAM-dependent methyltransferase